MKRVFNILVTIFGYRPSVTLDQFFKYGFSEQKMILCCDIINLVRRAAKDIKLAKMLNRKRSSVSREASRGRFSIAKGATLDGRGDFQYERDAINKVAKVTRVDEALMEQGEKGRSGKFRATIRSSDGGSPGPRSRRLNSTSSRFRDTAAQSFNNCHRHAHNAGRDILDSSIDRKLQEYAPLRSNCGQAVLKALDASHPIRDSHLIPEAST
jgi:hypothetical protein